MTYIEKLLTFFVFYNFIYHLSAFSRDLRMTGRNDRQRERNIETLQYNLKLAHNECEYWKSEYSSIKAKEVKPKADVGMGDGKE